MEFTKKQRHEIYKLAKEIQENDAYPYSMCISISIATRNLFNIGLLDTKTEWFPEFMKLKPSRKKAGDFWWRPENNDIRIRKFNKLIEMTK